MPEIIHNLSTYDPFSDTGEDSISKTQGYLHIRIQQRNGRKTLTTVQGLPGDLDQKNLLRVFKKRFACNGTIVQDEDLGKVIQLQGDQRSRVVQYLSEENRFVSRNRIKVHGF